ncbi:hypothetical protein FWG95_03425 [Candidatus Saccharibacteria bacterium]|nr:hypothetical protein [Candidatus Saccharibacteria bacterium]
MGIIVNQNQNRSELQQRIAAELREKQLKNGPVDGDIKAPEFDIEKSEYLKDRGGDTPIPGWVWLVGLVMTAVAVFALVKFVI